jgi:tetratricopeptide (TPR) repeat protein
MHIEAKKNIEHALKYAPYNTSFSSIYFWKGIILRNLEETDSAICYLSKAKINADIYAKASIYQTLYEIDKKRKKYEQAILYNDTALVYYDSIQKMVHHTEINSLIKKHSTEMYEQRVESQYQKDKAVLIICILLTISFAIFILMYISNRNKIK